MAAQASASYEWSEHDCLEVQVSCDDSRPDVLDELAHRVVFLLGESIAAVNAQARANDG